jgi:hypothetical protein
VNGTVATKIWIFRKGNGQWRVHPSPVKLRHDEEFVIQNLTDSDATVTFGAAFVYPDAGRIPEHGKSGTFKVVGRAPVYFEYDVGFPGGEYAEGGSKPGAIIDP